MKEKDIEGIKVRPSSLFPGEVWIAFPNFNGLNLTAYQAKRLGRALNAAIRAEKKR